MVNFFRDHGAVEDVFSAAMLGDDDIIKKYLDEGGDPNIRFSSWLSLLHYAAMGGNSKVIEMLINKGANVNGPADIASTPLFYAVSSRDKESVLTLLKHGADASPQSTSGKIPAEMTTYGRNPLNVATCDLFPNQEIVDALISNGAQMDAFNAVCLQNKDYIVEYAKNGGDINAVGPWGFTLVHAAAYFNRKEMVKLLLEMGADPNKPTQSSRYSNYPLNVAASNGNSDTVSLLLDHGAVVNAQEPLEKETALHLAVLYGGVEVAKILIAHGADVNIKNCRGETALDMTSNNDMEKLLIENGAEE